MILNLLMFIIGGHRHQPKKSPSHCVGARVDEGRLGGPSWAPAGWGVIVFLQAVSQGNRTRATMKTLPTPHPPPSPLRIVQPPTWHSGLGRCQLGPINRLSA